MVSRLSFLSTLVAILAFVASPTFAAPSTATTPAQRWIVQFEPAALAQAPGLSPVEERYALQGRQSNAIGRLDVSSPAAQAYRSSLEQQQIQVFNTIQRSFPNAALQRQYSLLFNGIALALPATNQAELERLRQLPGVKAIYPDLELEPHMFGSIPQIGADVLWNDPKIGGQSRAGEGVKIAVIDTGIRIDHPFFNPEGFSYPEGFPKGETAFTTPKVIAARAYFRPDRPPLPGSETPQQGPLDDAHGTHVAGIAAGVANTQAEIAGANVTLSGVAPRAYVMSYKIFYANETPFSGGSSIEFIAALEDAVADGADVINNSWGGLPTSDPAYDPISQAAAAAVDAGVTVIFSNGNRGPDNSTTGSPAFDAKLISVGASTTSQSLAINFLDVVEPADAPESLKAQRFGSASFGAPIVDQPFGPSSYVPVRAVGDSGLACEPLAPNTLSGRIALIERGVCSFSVKVFYAQQAGASAAIIYNNAAGGEEVIGMAAGDFADQIVIPSVFVANSIGVGLEGLYAQQGEAVKVQLDPRARVIDRVGDLLAGFSSRGPTFQGSLKPDVVAPGVNILSSGYGVGEGIESHLGYGIASGTSMAAPQVAGAAALLKQVNPTWSPADIKSALMSTANNQVWLDEAKTQLAGALEQGAGRIDLTRATAPGLLLYPPSLSFGELAQSVGAPTSSLIEVTARNISGGNQSYSIKATPTRGDLEIAVSPATLTLGPGQSANFQVTITVPADREPSDYEGLIELEGGPQKLHMPLWARTLPAQQAAKVLLIDNDGSSSFDFPDYSGYYGNLLVEQNISFNYLDLDAIALDQPSQTLPPIGELQKYEIIIWFTGDNFVPDGTNNYSLPLTDSDQTLMLAYLASGGKLIATGQDLSDASDTDRTPPDDPRYFRSDLYLYFGAEYVQDNVFGESGERFASGTGAQPWLSNIQLDLSTPSDASTISDLTGAGNANTVDELRLPDIDPRQVDEFQTVTPMFVAQSDARLDAGIIGVNDSAEPTLEKPYLAYPYRTIYLSFGLESVRSDTGTTSRKELLQSMLYWIVDQPWVTIHGAPESVEAGQEVTLTAEAGSNTPTSFYRYRWDFGDGSPILETDQTTVTHQYATAGSYTVRVQATNTWGHSAVYPLQP
jgi:subtilisin family serine protease